MNTTDNEPGEAISEVAQCAQAVLTALNVGDIQSGSPLHLKLREVMIAYRERAARAPVAAPQPPMCAVHAALDGKDNLTLEVGNGCIACSLHERTELLNVLEPFASPDGTQDSVTVLRNAIARATPPPTTPSAAAMRAAEEICAYFGDTDLAMGGHVNANGVAAIITRHLAGETSEPHCWHCGTILEAVELKLRCDQCPADCDDETCSAFGCAPNGGVSTAPVPAAGDDEGEIETRVGRLPLSLLDEIQERRNTIYTGFDYFKSAPQMKTDLDHVLAIAAALRSGEGEGK